MIIFTSQYLTSNISKPNKLETFEEDRRSGPMAMLVLRASLFDIFNGERKNIIWYMNVENLIVWPLKAFQEMRCRGRVSGGRYNRDGVIFDYKGMLLEIIYIFKYL